LCRYADACAGATSGAITDPDTPAHSDGAKAFFTATVFRCTALPFVTFPIPGSQPSWPVHSLTDEAPYASRFTIDFFAVAAFFATWKLLIVA
jgi:hypothetical protein